MSWHKHQEYDPTAAFIQNSRLQKVLDLKLENIDKLWFSQLKHISRDKLDTTLDLSKLETEKQKLKYYDVNMDAQEIREHGDDMAKKLKKMKLETKRDNYNFDLMRERTSLSVPVTLHLPRVTRQKTTVSKGSKRTGKKHANTKKKKTSKLKTSRVISVSDSNLHLAVKDQSESDHRNSDIEDEAKCVKSKALVQESFSSVTDKFLPLIRPPGEDKPADYRYLRQKMLTSLELPPVAEVAQHRKYSI